MFGLRRTCWRAAKFLQRFAKAYRWAHLDVAGLTLRHLPGLEATAAEPEATDRRRAHPVNLREHLHLWQADRLDHLAGGHRVLLRFHAGPAS